jgi:hypothetical protein
VLQRTPGTFYVLTYHRGPAPLNTALGLSSMGITQGRARTILVVAGVLGLFVAAAAITLRPRPNPRGDSRMTSGLVVSVGRSMVTRFSRGEDTARVRLANGQLVYASVAPGIAVRKDAPVMVRESIRTGAASEYQITGVAGR